MGATHTYNETPDVLALLDQELASCVMPSIPDPSKATPEELIRDLHRVLAGNGGPTRGLIYKTAATNVSIKLLRIDAAKQAMKQAELADSIAAQQQRCDEIQADTEATDEAEMHAREVAVAVAEAEHTTVKRIGMAIRENKSIIVVIIVGAILMLNSYINSPDNRQRIDPAIIEQTLRTILESEAGHATAVSPVTSDKPAHRWAPSTNNTNRLAVVGPK